MTISILIQVWKVRIKMIRNRNIRNGRRNMKTFEPNVKFLNLVQPLDEKEFDSLKETILKNGYNEPIFIWHGMIVYHYEQYRICNSQQLSYFRLELEFDREEEIIDWICKKELQRKDLTNERRKYLIGKRYSSMVSLYNEETDISSLLLSQNEESFSKNICKYKIAEQIGCEYAICHNTVLKYTIYMNALDNIFLKDKVVAKRILAGNLKVSHETIIELSRLPKEDICSIQDFLHDKKNTRVSYPQIKNELQWKKIFIAQEKGSQKQDLPIKKVPKYDPDSEISSLALTIPSWIGSITRTHTRTNFNLITENGRVYLQKQLESLRITVDDILQDIKEEV